MPLKRKARRPKTKTSRRRRSRKGGGKNRALVAAASGGKKMSPIRATQSPTRSFLGFGLCTPPKNLYATIKTSAFWNAIGATWTQTLYHNSCFDPSGTIGSGQPRYFDTFCGANNSTALYNRYRVHESILVIEGTNLTDIPVYVGCATYQAGKTGPPAYTSVNEMRERDDTRWISLAANTAGGSIKKLVIKCRPKDILGFKDLADDDATAAAYNANPGHLISAQVFVMPVDGASTTFQTNISVTMIQKCQFFYSNDVADF